MATSTKQGIKRTKVGKKAKKETVKQVLANPYSLYWPLIVDDTCKTFQAALDECLPVQEEKKIEKPHWRVLKEMSKEQRKQFKHSNSTMKKDYVFGVNEVTKSLEKSILQAVLIASDVSPRLLVKHVVDLCIIKNIPILVIPELRQSLHQRCGVSAVVFGVKNNDSLVQTIKNIHSTFPVPKDHMHYLQMVKHKEDNVLKSNVKKTKIEECDKATDHKVLYLYRTSKSERVFKPEKSEIKVANVAAPIKEDCEFMALDESVEESIPKVDYKALVVKRLKGNKNREKRKREITGCN